MTNPRRTESRAPRPPKPTPLALMILALLSERPMHPYEMQRLMIARGDDKVVRVQRGSLYPAVERLEAAGLVEHEVTEKTGRRPERTVYRITERGSETAVEWITDMLSVHRNEYPEFGAAMSFVGLIDPRTFRKAIATRVAQLSTETTDLETTTGPLSPVLPRLFLLEIEYLVAMQRAELAFLEGLLADLDAGRLDWSKEQIEAWYHAIVADGHFHEAVSWPAQDEDEAAAEDTMPG